MMLHFFWTSYTSLHRCSEDLRGYISTVESNLEYLQKNYVHLHKQMCVKCE